ncbi:hypothetical protein [Candidatus Protochlamydia phocaeensis]|uniref:hypothetical protein n=1 Tax=Candidatus Protochlamydia phocaeensis TaxID=1414722 RepID=UPI000837FC75|nr:hypothetical protein [Candidatus Protochlamydia phocaeensis]
MLFKNGFASALILIPSLLMAAKGEVILEKGDYYVIDTGRGCSVVEWYGGNNPSEGDTIVGDIESYGFKDVYNLSSRDESRFYVEDYLLSEDDAIEKVYELGG